MVQSIDIESLKSELQRLIQQQTQGYDKNRLGRIIQLRKVIDNYKESNSIGENSHHAIQNMVRNITMSLVLLLSFTISHAQIFSGKKIHQLPEKTTVDSSELFLLGNPITGTLYKIKSKNVSTGGTAIDTTSLSNRIDELVSGTIPDGDKGDITVSAGGSVWTLNTAIPGQFNPIAGSNMSITGAYPNITFNTTNAGAVVDITATNNTGQIWTISGTTTQNIDLALTKAAVGLTNVDNTSDASKPVSTATQTALNLKANLAGPTFTGSIVFPSTVTIGTITPTELSYIDGLTSNAQSQFNGKQPINQDLTDISGISPTNDDLIQRKSGAWVNRSLSQVKSDLSLNLVENTALSTWIGSTNITTLGTIGTGTWNGTAISIAKGGIPSGGTSGYVLKKLSGTSYDVGWVIESGGGGGSGVWGAITGTLPDQTDLQDALDDKENAITATTSADYYRGDKTFQTLNKSAVGLGNVENTALSTWAGTSNITTLGTVTAGSWMATAIATSKGGVPSGGTAGYVLKKLSGSSYDYGWDLLPPANAEYTEGDIDASISGIAFLMEVGSNTLQPVQGTVADGLLVNLGSNNDVTVTGTITANAGTNLNTSLLALESGGNIAAIKAKTDNIPALGQALAAASVPVVLTAAQISTLTPPSAITGFALETTLGSVKTSVELIDDAIYTDGSGTASKGVLAFGQDGTNPQAIKTDASGELQVDVLSMPTVTITALTNSSIVKAQLQDNAGTAIVLGNTTMSASLPVTIASNQTALSVTNGGTFAVQAAQSGTWNITNLSGTVSLPTGASTLGEQQTQTTSLQLIDDAVYTTATGTVSKGLAILGQDGTNPRAIKTDASGELQIDVLTLPTVTISALTNSSIVKAQLQDNAGTAIVLGQTTMTGSLPVTIASNQTAIPITDNSGSITVDNGGTFAVQVSSALPAGTNAIGKLSANNGVDIGDVDVASVPSDPFGLNADASSATGSISAKLRFIASTGIPITGTVTVGSHAVTNAGTFAVQVDGNALTSLQLLDDVIVADNAGFTDGTTKLSLSGFIYDEVAGTALTENDAAAARINVNRALVAAIEDGTTRGRYATVSASNALKVDGSAVTQPVSGTVTASNAAGDIAHDGVDSGNPLKIGFKASTSLPTAVSTGDRTNGISDRYGRQITTAIDGNQQIWKSGRYTTAQTGTNIWTPTSGNRFVITSIQITTGGTTAGVVTIWGAPTGTTSFTSGTDQVFFDGEFAPSATARPGALPPINIPLYSDTTNDCLKITTSAGMTVYVVVYGYEITP